MDVFHNDINYWRDICTRLQTERYGHLNTIQSLLKEIEELRDQIST